MNRDDLKTTAIGIGAGYAVKKGTETIICNNMVPYYRWLKDTNITDEEKKLLKGQLYDCFEKSGLKEKGVTLNHVDEKNLAKVQEMENKKIVDFVKSVYEGFTKKPMPDVEIPKSFTQTINNEVEIASKGKNSFFNCMTKSIVLNTDKSAMSGFHELGHADNFLSRGIPKIFSIVRSPAKQMAPAVLAIGLLMPKKNKVDQQDSSITKTASFIKDNAGKLTLALFTPRIIEEGLASIKGYNYIKGKVPSTLLKKVGKSYAKNLSTYIVTAGVVALSTALAINVKDRICEKKA